MPGLHPYSLSKDILMGFVMTTKSLSFSLFLMSDDRVIA